MAARITDARRLNILLRLESLIGKLRLKSTTVYSVDMIRVMNMLIAGYVKTENMTDLQRRRYFDKMLKKELGETYDTLGANILSDMMEMAKLYNEVFNYLYDTPTDKVYRYKLDTLIHGYELGDLLNSNEYENLKVFKKIIVDALTKGSHPRTVSIETKRYTDKTIQHVSDIVIQGAMDKARSDAMLDSYKYLEDEGYAIMFQWVATLEVNTCKQCRELDFQQWKKVKNIPPIPAHFRCLTGDTLISASDLISFDSDFTARNQLSRIFRRRFDGVMYRITTASGNHIKVTPNHPVMTPQGFEPANSLNVGDYIAANIGGDSTVDVDKEDIKISVENLFASLLMSDGVSSISMPTTSEDFHGDVTDKEVNIVSIDSSLLPEFNTSIREVLGEKNLISAHLDAVSSFSSNGDIDSIGLRNIAAFGGDVTGGNLRGSFLGSHIAPLDPFLFTSTSEFDSVFLKDSVDDLTRDTLIFRELIDGHLSDGISFDEIVSIDTFNFSGHIYNLETKYGYYIANNLISHNCRCTVVPITEYGSPDTIRQGVQYDDEGNPTPTSYTNIDYKKWLSLQPIEVQRAINSKEYISRTELKRLLTMR